MKEMYYDSYPRALAQLVADVNSREFSPDEYYIVLCPDRYTQSVEQALFCDESDGYSGAMDCEVLTLSRLAHRIVPRGKTLSQEGGVMITARAVAAVAPELKYYSRAAAFPDFAREVYRTLQQIASSDVDTTELAAVGATRDKLNDLRLIKSEYDKIKGEYSDSADRLKALADYAAKSSVVRGSHFFAVGYSDMTKLNRRALCALAEHAKSFTVYCADPPSDRREGLTVFGAQDKVGEYKQVAAEIRDHVDGGGRYSDVAVLCAAPRALKRILEEYEIPIYTDETKPLAETPPLCALTAAYKLRTALDKRSALDCAALVALSKNPYAGCDPQDAEKLQYEVRLRALGYVSPDYEFNDFGARRAAARGVEIADAFASSVGFGTAVRAVLEFCGFTAVREALGGNGTDDVSPIVTLAELSDRYGSGDFDTDAKAFFSAAQAINVNTLPRERDCVTVTVPQSLRLSAVKKLFITDFNEGVVPSVVSDTGLISDEELAALGGAIEPSVQALNRRARAELRAVVRNAESVYVTYSCAVGRPAAFIKELCERITELNYAELRDVLLCTSDPCLIAKHASTAGAARELAARNFTKHGRSLRNAVCDAGVCAAPFADKIDLPKKTSISVSELSHWFRCPYYRFLSDTVGVKERKSGFGVLDFGIVVHDFMQRFVADEKLDCSIEAVQALMDEALKARDVQPDAATYARMIADAVDYATANAEIIRAGKYKVEQTEYGFGGVRLGKAGLEFIGYIDRFDVCGNHARIIDYKTGSSKRFDLEQCINGCDMQLPLYAYVLPYDVTGMFYVRLGNKYATDKPERTLSGCMVADVSVAYEYDTDMEAGGAPSRIIPARLKIDKDGAVAFSGRRSSALMDKAEFEALQHKCKNNADVAADEISAGYITRSPVYGACDYCPYIGICGGRPPRGGEPSDGDEEDRLS